MAEKRKSSDDVKKEELDDITTCCICTEACTDRELFQIVSALRKGCDNRSSSFASER